MQRIHVVGYFSLICILPSTFQICTPHVQCLLLVSCVPFVLFVCFSPLTNKFNKLLQVIEIMAAILMCSRLTFMDKINDSKILVLLLYDFFLKCIIYYYIWIIL